MGCVTGKGLAALFRESFGVRISFIAMLLLFLINTLLTATEFAGIAAASEIFGFTRYAAIPIAVVAVFFFVLRFDNKVVERTFVIFSLIYLTYIASALLAHPELARGRAGRADSHIPLADRRLAGGGRRPDRHDDLAVHAVLSAVGRGREGYRASRSLLVRAPRRDQRIDPRDRRSPVSRLSQRRDDLLSVELSMRRPHRRDAGRRFRVALRPLAGLEFAAAIFALGILNAALFTATVLPLSNRVHSPAKRSASKARSNRKFEEAPVLFQRCSRPDCSIGAATRARIPHAAAAQDGAGCRARQRDFFCSADSCSMLVVVNRKQIMGEYMSKPWPNAIAGATVAVVGTLSIVYVRAVRAGPSRRQRCARTYRRVRSTARCDRRVRRRPESAHRNLADMTVPGRCSRIRSGDVPLSAGSRVASAERRATRRDGEP